eukprot:CAMPEP_0178427290 /NCGR_PEP_ID=MMETSP0689_2-20121128/29669_1 /TAXON_ID=160604 /ORGANISM="Amphidinium massartii, Strain CS-259" /LENGTH=278 /DNA_ID=CAMNT_0020048993 /DNA_START=1 /DNA_END=837 /DNA_ORIENTATION=-
MDEDTCATCAGGAWDAWRSIPYISLLAMAFTIVGLVFGFVFVGFVDEGLEEIGWTGLSAYLALTLLCLFITLIVDILVLPFAFLASGKVREAFWWNWGCSRCGLSCYRRFFEDEDDMDSDALLEHDQTASKADLNCKKLAIDLAEIVLFILLVITMLCNMANLVFITIIAMIFWLFLEACELGDGIVLALFKILEALGLVDNGTIKGWLNLCDEEHSYFVASVMVGVGSIILVLTQALFLACLVRNGTVLRREPTTIGSGKRYGREVPLTAALEDAEE